MLLRLLLIIDGQIYRRYFTCMFSYKQIESGIQKINLIQYIQIVFFQDCHIKTFNMSGSIRDNVV